MLFDDELDTDIPAYLLRSQMATVLLQYFAIIMLVTFITRARSFTPFLRVKPSSLKFQHANKYSSDYSFKTSKEGTSICSQLIHSTIETKPDGKCIIIGDVHGCCDELEELLLKCEYSRDRDHVVLVGDLVNKGPKSLEAVQLAVREGFFSVRGNHDDYALAARLRVGRFKGVNELPDDIKWVDLLSSEEASWLENLPFTLALPHFECLIVHAGLVPGIPLKEQSLENMYKMRSLTQSENDSELFVASDRDPCEANGEQKREPWAKVWAGPFHIYFGHDAKQGLQLEKWATGLDTGCLYGRKLTAQILPDKKLVSVNALHTYVSPGS